MNICILTYFLTVAEFQLSWFLPFALHFWYRWVLVLLHPKGEDESYETFGFFHHSVWFLFVFWCIVIIHYHDEKAARHTYKEKVPALLAKWNSKWQEQGKTMTVKFNDSRYYDRKSCDLKVWSQEVMSFFVYLCVASRYGPDGLCVFQWWWALFFFFLLVLCWSC